MSPRPPLLMLMAVSTVPFIVGLWAPAFAAAGALCQLAAFALAAFDAWLTPSSRAVAVSRRTGESLSVGAENPVALELENRSRRALALEIADEVPQPGVTRGVPGTVRLAAGGRATVRYRYTPARRGQHVFRAVALRFPSVLGLWMVHERRALETPVRVYPDIRALRRYELLAQQNRLREVGMKAVRARGGGGEFSHLREYRREDSPGDISWKATAKHQRLISREFTLERSQNVLVMLDCGRSMWSETDGLSHLDFGLNAAIYLAYVALRQGDNVGFLAFSNRIERYLAPARGQAAARALLRHTFDLEPRRVVSDYVLACEELARRHRKRTLVVLITHALDSEHQTSMLSHVRVLAASHLLLLVCLRDVALDRFARRVPADEIEAFEVAAASELLLAQAQTVAQLRRSGVLVLETLPTRLSPDLINEYLELKARRLL